MILRGDCLKTLKTLESNSVDSVVTDPPYGLKFMGKKWDYEVPSVEIWREVLRVLKPGGHALIACGTRTQHRMAVNIEDAGFEVRDVITWHYGSGFPKSTDVSKRIDKEAGAKREVVGTKTEHNIKSGNGNSTRLHNSSGNRETIELNITAPSTDSAKQWQGWGTALKPATEFWTLVRKPIEGTVAQNVLKYGVGGLNIDATRIKAAEDHAKSCARTFKSGIWAKSGEGKTEITTEANALGRFPANVIFDESAAEMLDEQSGGLRARGNKTPKDHGGKYNASSYEFGGRESGNPGDSGGASRFFYCAKASKAERNAGLEGMPTKEKQTLSSFGDQTGFECSDGASRVGNKGSSFQQNVHPTVKPLKLMQYLIKLITPEGGVCLDPFMGSGTTGVACKSLGFEFIGCELLNEYAEIAERRIEAAV